MWGDDEVAVGQAPDGERGSLTWPLVNLRHVLELARVAGVLKAENAAPVLAALRAVFYPQRTTAAVRAVCHRQGESRFAQWLTEQCEQDRHFGDLKRADALAAVRMALGGLPAGSDAQVLPWMWETTYFRRWSNAFAREEVDGLELRTEDRVVYQQVFDPAFRQTWAAYLKHRSLAPTCGPSLPLEVRLAQATGGALPADRVFHPAVDLRDKATVALLLAGETGLDRQSVARYAQALVRAGRSRPGFSSGAVREDLTRRLLLRVWQCPEQSFDAESSARGLVCGARAVQAAKPLVPGLIEEINETTELMEAARDGH